MSASDWDNAIEQLAKRTNLVSLSLAGNTHIPPPPPRPQQPFTEYHLGTMYRSHAHVLACCCCHQRTLTQSKASPRAYYVP